MTKEEFKAVRERLGLTPTEFGGKLGYGQKHLRVAEVESGKKSVSNQVEVICNLLIKIDDLEKEITRLKGDD